MIKIIIRVARIITVEDLRVQENFLQQLSRFGMRAVKILTEIRLKEEICQSQKIGNCKASQFYFSLLCLLASDQHHTCDIKFSLSCWNLFKVLANVQNTFAV